MGESLVAAEFSFACQVLSSVEVLCVIGARRPVIVSTAFTRELSSSAGN